MTYRARVYPVLLGRLRATVRAEKGALFDVDTLDLYASRSRAEFARRASKTLALALDVVESDLLALLVEAEKAAKESEEKADTEASASPAMTEAERGEALALLRRPDLLDQRCAEISRDRG